MSQEKQVPHTTLAEIEARIAAAFDQALKDIAAKGGPGSGAPVGNQNARRHPKEDAEREPKEPPRKGDDKILDKESRKQWTRRIIEAKRRALMNSVPSAYAIGYFGQLKPNEAQTKQWRRFTKTLLRYALFGSDKPIKFPDWITHSARAAIKTMLDDISSLGECMEQEDAEDAIADVQKIMEREYPGQVEPEEDTPPPKKIGSFNPSR